MQIPKLVCPQLAEEPKNANAEWLKSNDPRISKYAEGTDPQGNPIVAYLVNGRAIRTNVWQDWTDAGNHSRYPWNPVNEYWLDVVNVEEYDENLIHETVEDRRLGGSSTEKTYDDAHAHYANPAEFEARHGDAKAILRSLGWRL
jgi:hypothetical protein